MLRLPLSLLPSGGCCDSGVTSISQFVSRLLALCTTWQTCLHRPILCLPRLTPRLLRLPRPAQRPPAPLPVIEHVVPAPVAAHAAPAPVFEYVAPAPVIEYIAPAPAMTFAVPSQQVPPAYTMTTVTPDVNFDIPGLVNPQFSITPVEASAPQVVGSLFDAPVYNQIHQEHIGETTQNTV